MRKEQAVFIGSFEVLPGTGSELKKTGSVGAFVYCLCTALNKGQAELRMRQALAEDHYIIKLTDFICAYIDMEFDNEDDQKEFDDHKENAEISDDVIYGEFYSY